MASYRQLGVSILVAGITLFGCANESNQDILAQEVTNAPDASPDSGPVGTCAPIASAIRLPARREAQTDAPVSTGKTVYVDDAFNSFGNYCGGCHIDVGLGGFQTTRANFADVVNQDWVDSIGYNKTNTVMPPPSVGGKLPSERSPDDPVIELQKLLQAWVDSGRPRDSFVMPVDQVAQSGPYRLSPDVAGALTNIGNCLPDTSLYAWDKATMAKMDAKFAAMTFGEPGKGTRAQQIGLPL